MTKYDLAVAKHDLAVALAKHLEEEGITDEELERLIHDAKESYMTEQVSKTQHNRKILKQENKQ